MKKLISLISCPIGALCLFINQAVAEDCPPFNPPGLVSKSDEVYAGLPFGDGEELTFDINYMGVFVGWAKLGVDKPIRYKDRWHQVFSGAANTAPSYEIFFVGRDSLKAYSLPGSFAVSKFKLEQYEHKMLSKAFVASKWIDYDQNNCLAKETVIAQGDNPVRKEFKLESGANDVVSAFYQMRTKSLNVGDVHRILIYTSEKNWFAEMSVLAKETVTVPAGKFEAAKIKLKTYLGKDLQQRGDLYVWIALTPEKPVVKIEGEIKIGKVKFNLSKFKPRNVKSH